MRLVLYFHFLILTSVICGCISKERILRRRPPVSEEVPPPNPDIPIVDQTKDSIDKVAKNLFQIEQGKAFDPAQVDRWTKDLSPEGQWNDINYGANKLQFYAPIQHLERLRAMASAYVSAASQQVGREELKGKLVVGLKLNERFFKNSQANEPFVWDNWFPNYISAPRLILDCLILLGESLSPSDLQAIVALVPNQSEAAFKNGDRVFDDGAQNKVWIAENNLRIGVLRRNHTEIESAVSAIASTLKEAPAEGREGIKPDISFHQHGAQVYQGGYGYWFIESLVGALIAIEGTVFTKGISQKDRDFLLKYILDGFQWTLYKRTFDFGVVGRNISRQGGTLVGNQIDELLDRLVQVYPSQPKELKELKDHVAGQGFPLVGNRFFFSSDLMVHRGQNFYLSAKVISNRTVGTESINGENLKGYYLPLGATNILIRGSEYHSIFPVWNWSKIPGVTSEEDKIPPITDLKTGSNQFAGGVSDGVGGMISFELEEMGIKALKTYIFADNIMICLGAGIKGSGQKPLITTVNQAEKNGDSFIKEGGTVTPIRGRVVTSRAEWVHHDRVGYVMLSSQPLVVNLKSESGSLSETSKLIQNSPEQKRDVFSLWIDHGTVPAGAVYAYGVVAGVEQGEMNQASRSAFDFKIKINRENLQIVQRGSDFYVVASKAQNLVLDINLAVEASQPVIFKARRDGSKLKVWVTNPLQNGKPVFLNFNGRYSGTGATAMGQQTRVKIDPSSEPGRRGQPVYVELIQD